jgi:hypothetical protein
MGFKIHQMSDTQGFEHLPASGITPKIGMALAFNDGALKTATGTVKPTYISACDRDVAVKVGELIPVIRVRDDMLFETTSSVAMTTVKPGDKVTISADGLQVTATTADGIAEVVSIEDTAAGGTVFVRI